MEAINKWIYWLSDRLYYVAGAAIVAMMLITTADVTLRYFKCPIPGTYELVMFFGAIAASFAIAHTYARNGHVFVNLFIRLLPDRLQALIGVITEGMGFLLFVIISWQSFRYAGELQHTGEVSMTLEVPFYPFVYGVAFSTAVAAILILTALINSLLKVIKK